IQFFRQSLGYRYLGHWKDRANNSNIEETLLADWLKGQGHDNKAISHVLKELDKARALSGSKTLYEANREIYGLLRYGVKVKPDVGEQFRTIWLIDWEHISSNDFAIAEEVTIAGTHAKRPDIVLYVNGIALGVLELKRSTVSVSEGIRQNLDNQKKEFIRPFFATVQLVMAGNNTQGLWYGIIDTPEKYWLTWKEASSISTPLDRGLDHLCRKGRLLELIHDFCVFDGGSRKICRHNQYFGVRAAQEYIQRREGGIIWHTQGSGKSLTMVWLAKWIREHITDSRVLIITDRTELDEQIEQVFLGVDEDIYRTSSGADLINVLNQSERWLICSLIHKFGSSEEGDIKQFIRDIQSHLPPGFHPRGELFVFVDECHRTQSGDLHQAMKATLPGATLIGFTGTPLLKKDKTSIEVFGPYIHTYKYDEAVRDGVVLDLRYESRDIDQSLTSPDKIDQWFEAKTRGLTPFARAQLKQRWGTMQQVLSAEDRLKKIVADIQFDMEIRDRLQSGRGNAMLVSSSIYAACRFFELFQQPDLAGKCAIITSYKPGHAAIKGEETGEGMTEKLRQYDIYRKMLAAHFGQPEDVAANKVEQFEIEVKKRFIEAPAQMKLLIVVDKLLTGFDAPPATYLYIDKQMRDHGLFQAICRVNRLDGEDKEYGYVIDYKDLFRSLEQSIQDYTGGAFDGYDKEDVAGLLQNRLEKGREQLEELREKVKALCEPVQPPYDTPAYIHYFCGTDSADPAALKATEPRRITLYNLVGSLLRAYANLANDLGDAGYTDAEALVIKGEVDHFEQARREVKLASGDYIDMKLYEPAMRHLLDTYIRAEDSKQVSAFDDMTLVELIVERGEEAVDALPKGIRENPEAMAETIENNVRKLIVDEHAVNPKYYDKMSELLSDLIQMRKQEATDYQVYLEQLVELARKASKPETQPIYPASITTPALRALYDNLDQNEALAVNIDSVIRSTKKEGWHGHTMKEREVRNAVRKVLQSAGVEDLDRIMEIVKHQREY
ncbi:MAG: HsdR family type I site-specific deoxyribonuclease, partial [Chloroflexi bacterium]|nr:HsdR family type I site-specific deoxyribonuclease [Chloroflexota bacterium]